MKPAVLFVDDEMNVLTAVQRVMRKESYEIHTATSGREGLQILSETRIDVVVSDEEMPGMTGAEFLSRVRRDYSDTIRIMLTGKATLETAMRAINMGEIYRFFTKPCDPLELTVAIRQALSVKRLAEQSVRLLNKTREQRTMITALESSQPGISSVHRAQDGAIIIDDVGSESIESLVLEIQRELDGKA